MTDEVALGRAARLLRSAAELLEPVVMREADCAGPLAYVETDVLRAHAALQGMIAGKNREVGDLELYEIPITRSESVTQNFHVWAATEEGARELAMQRAADTEWPRAADADYHFD